MTGNGMNKKSWELTSSAVDWSISVLKSGHNQTKVSALFNWFSH